MQCFPLTSIIFALGNPRIDYLSLDIEGAEFEVSIVITNANNGILNKKRQYNIKVLNPMIPHITEMHLYIFIKKVLESVPWNLVNIHMISVEIVRRKLNEYADGMHIDQYEDIVTLLELNGYRNILTMPHTDELLSFEVFFIRDDWQ